MKMDWKRVAGWIGQRAQLLPCALLASGALAPVAAQDREAAAVRVADVLPTAAAARVNEMAEAAGQDGVPPGLVYRKALEGAAKGIPPERIVRALEGYTVRLRQARSLVGPGHNAATLAAAAEALRRGVSADAVRRFAATRPGDRNLAVPLIVLGELTEAGVPTDRALEMVRTAMERGARGDRMLSLSAAVRRRMAQGDSWQRAVEAVRRRVIDRQNGATRARPDGGGQARRQGPHRRPLDVSPVAPGSNPPRQQGDRRLGDGSA
jgi:hypothetical protein